MNSNQSRLIVSLSIGNIILTIVLLSLFNKHFSYNLEIKMQNKHREMQSTQGIVKDTVYEEISPSGDRVLALYEVPDNPVDQEFIIIKNKVSKTENYIYFLDVYKDGIPKWLGNDFIYFTTYCGTSCQGLDLVNVNSKQIYNGVLSYMVLDEKRGPYTIFKDWFGREFTLDGLINDITSETSIKKTYLIFKMEDEKGISLGAKRFLFTGNTLREE